ncbi:hypothetical protein [Streptomyces sp. NPDC088350]|uniref:hypothetical protein n=1 Tax=Streptomyces sp. NPDC088350 TaxID=3365854 RepID=UPI00381A4BFD
MYRESAVTVAVVLLTTALIIVVAPLAGAAAGKLARMGGATYATALTRAATVAGALAVLLAQNRLTHPAERGQPARPSTRSAGRAATGLPSELPRGIGQQDS